MPYVTLSDQRLFYARQGRVAAGQPQVILLHGAGGSHLDWPPQLRKIEGAMVYTLDLPGHGRSEKPGRTTIDDYADVVTDLADALSLDNVVLAGHSMGGAIAQIIGLRRPDWLAGLVLLGTGARLRVAPQFLDGVLDDFGQIAELLMGFYWSKDTPAEIVDRSQRLLLRNDPLVVRGDLLACDRFDIGDQLAAITLPALVIGSTADRMTPLKYSQYLVDRLPDAQLVTVEGCGHMLAVERAETIAAAVQTFVNQFRPD
jgi:pimeloyl-ACP methyl ester carboxylesterase